MADRYAIDIDELVLYGFSPGDRAAIAQALSRELTRLVEAAPPAALRSGTDASDPGTRTAHRIDAGRIDLAADATPQAVGVAVARAIHSGLGAPR